MCEGQNFACLAKWLKFWKESEEKMPFLRFLIFGCLFQFLDSEFRISQGNVANYDLIINYKLSSII
jgi:hypothetical protein